MLGTEELLAECDLYLGGTFAWHPAACVGALKSIEIIERDRVLDHVVDMERLALGSLMPLAARYEIVGDVRIRGLYIALEFVKNKDSKEPAEKLAREIHFECIRRGLVPVHEEGLWWLRLYPALNMPSGTFATVCSIVEEAIEAVSRKYGLGIA